LFVTWQSFLGLRPLPLQHYLTKNKIMNSNPDQIFINRLNQHPKLRERMDALLKVVENAVGEYTKADAAEQHIIDELRKLGNEALIPPLI